MRINILLECAETGERLYLTSKNKRNNPERLELKKYSPKLRKHVVFKETKNNFEKFGRVRLVPNSFLFVLCFGKKTAGLL